MYNRNKNELIKDLLDIFKQTTDKENKAKLIQLSERLSEKAEKNVDTRTISSDITLLTNLGFSIKKEPGGYYFEHRMLNRAETKLLCDQILFSSIIPANRKDSIIKGLMNDLTTSDRELIGNKVTLNYKTEMLNLIYNDTLTNIDRILEAIEKNKQIKFEYGDFDENKKWVKKKEYKASPFEFLYEQSKYYIACQTNEDADEFITRNFRIDLMKNITLSNTLRKENPLEKVNVNEFVTTQMNMYSPEVEDITLEVNKKGLRGIYDKLGLDSNIKVEKINSDKYNVTFKASLDGTKFFVLQYIDQMKVVKPAKLKNAVIKSLKTALEKYE
ncbi:MAG: WYL domain-containing protein [Clostridia bacterium]|nr:WYL domain-containing protein [Clostridia bacterium]